MAKAVTIDTSTAKKLVKELEHFEKVKTRILSLLPGDMVPYGSKLWWEKEELEADEDIKKGRVAKMSSLNDLDKPLKTLFR